jgi:DNA-directed RNA polymerase subunit RPC12/RpoP
MIELDIEALKGEPYLIRGGVRLTGQSMCDYHRLYNTASYHCIKCGAEIPNGNYPCPVCKITNEEIKKQYEEKQFFADHIKIEEIKPYK